MTKKSLKKEVECLVAYIKEHTHNSDNWVAVKHRDVPEICDVSQYYVPRIFEEVQEHENIAYKRDTEARTYNKPLIFKYIDKDQKFEYLKEELKYKNVTKPQIEELYKILEIKDYVKFVEYLNLINFLKYQLNYTDTKKIELDELSNIYLKSEKEIRKMLSLLREKRILKEDKNLDYMISLPETEDNVKSKPAKTHLRAADKPSAQANDSDAGGESVIEYSETTVPEPIDEKVESKSATIEQLVEEIENMGKIISSFQDHMAEQSDLLLDQALVELDTEGSVEKDKEIQSIQKAMDKLVAENKELKSSEDALKEKIKDLEGTVSDLEKAVELLKKHKDQFREDALIRHEVMLGEISNHLAEDSKVPSWSRDEKTNARLRAQITAAVTSAISDIIS